MKILATLSIMAVSTICSASDYTVPLNFYVYKSPSANQGSWHHPTLLKDFDRSGECKGLLSETTWTPCMINTLVRNAELSLAEIDLEVNFQPEIHYTDFQGFDVECKKDRCVANTTQQWNPYKFDVLLLPRANDPVGHTRAYRAFGQDYFTIGLGIGTMYLQQAKNVLVHELAHGMRFDGHTSEPITWTFNKGKSRSKCNELTVKPYSESGLKPSCSHRSPLGVFFPEDKQCQWYYSFNVPYYKDIFREVFGCWLSYNTKVIPPTPTPTPTPDPLPQPEEECCCCEDKAL